MLLIEYILIGSVLAALWFVTERRHRRTRRRLQALERRLQDSAARTDRVERHVYADLAARARSGVIPPAPAPIRFLSQFGEDALLFDLFEGKRDGFFIEAGAYDGTSLSTTFALESLGWSGLLVEPMPGRFAQCRDARPGSRVVHAALGPRGSRGTTAFEVPEAAEGAMADLAASIRLSPALARQVGGDHGAVVRSIRVPLTSLAALLNQAPPTSGIDVAVIDVEGFEAQVLDGLELDRYRPRVLLIEDLTHGQDARTRDLLVRHSYERVVWLGHNGLWVDARDDALLARAKMLADGGAIRGGRS